MKLFLIAALTILSLNAFALDWYDIDLDDKVTLDQNINFTKEGITLKKGDSFKVYDRISLPIKVDVFLLEVENCPGADLSTDMIIIDPSGRRNDPSVGVQLSQSCSLEVYVETKDLFTKSLFVK
ncbi:MAG: hypothetical protein ACOYL6_03660 [Bacteriovoracaceae bacterium]